MFEIELAVNSFQLPEELNALMLTIEEWPESAPPATQGSKYLLGRPWCFVHFILYENQYTKGKYNFTENFCMYKGVLIFLPIFFHSDEKHRKGGEAFCV